MNEQETKTKKARFIEWITLIPDDIFEGMYAIHPFEYIQAEYLQTMAKANLVGQTAVVDDNGMLKVSMPWGSLILS